MPYDQDGFPTVGRSDGVAVQGTSPDDTGQISMQGANSGDELLEIAGVKQLDDEEEIKKHLPDHAELLENGELRAQNNRDGDGWDYLNAKRRFILEEIADGRKAIRVDEDYGFSQSYIYRTKSVFGFLVEDSVLRGAFIEEDGKFTPESESFEASEEVEKIPVTEAKDMAEEAYGNGLEEAQVETMEQAIDSDESSSDGPASLFEDDEWWNIMKILIENGEDAYARRISSEIDFD